MRARAALAAVLVAMVLWNASLRVLAVLSQSLTGISYAVATASRLSERDPAAARGSLELMTAGLTNQDIARQIGITPSGVNQHILSLLGKLGAANRTEAAAIAVRKGLVKP